jgi:hypothetical protein
MSELKIKDSGERDTYSSGAVRDNHEGKGRMDLVSTQGLLRLTRWYELGSRKYSDRNWEKGMNISRYVDAAMRHLVKYLAGCDDEDHLSAVAWNVFAIMHHEYYLPEQQDLPEWQGRETKWKYPLDLGKEE